MKRLCAIGLMLTIGWQPLLPRDPLERSLFREAARLAGEIGRRDRLAKLAGCPFAAAGHPDCDQALPMRSSQAGSVAVDDSTIAVSKGGAGRACQPRGCADRREAGASWFCARGGVRDAGRDLAWFGNRVCDGGVVAVLQELWQHRTRHLECDHRPADRGADTAHGARPVAWPRRSSIAGRRGSGNQAAIPVAAIHRDGDGGAPRRRWSPRSSTLAHSLDAEIPRCVRQRAVVRSR